MPRKAHQYHYIYKTTNTITGKYYIGMHSTSNIDDGYLGSGKRLRRSINKYGKENHIKEIIEYCNNREELAKRENEIVNETLLKENDCMNLKIGGEGGWAQTIEQRLRAAKAGGLAMANKFKSNPDFVNEVKNRSSKTLKRLHKEGKIKPYDWTGKKHSIETKLKMSESAKGLNIGSKNGSFGTCWITKDGFNKKIKKDELDTFISDGWNRGRKLIKS